MTNGEQTTLLGPSEAQEEASEDAAPQRIIYFAKRAAFQTGRDSLPTLYAVRLADLLDAEINHLLVHVHHRGGIGRFVALDYAHFAAIAIGIPRTSVRHFFLTDAGCDLYRVQMQTFARTQRSPVNDAALIAQVR